MICEHEAPDAETVQKVQREAGAAFDQIWSCEVIGGSLLDGYPFVWDLCLDAG